MAPVETHCCCSPLNACDARGRTLEYLPKLLHHHTCKKMDPLLHLNPLRSWGTWASVHQELGHTQNFLCKRVQALEWGLCGPICGTQAPYLLLVICVEEWWSSWGSQGEWYLAFFGVLSASSTVLNILCALICIILKATLWSRYYLYPCMMQES